MSGISQVSKPFPFMKFPVDLQLEVLDHVIPFKNIRSTIYKHENINTLLDMRSVSNHTKDLVDRYFLVSKEWTSLDKGNWLLYNTAKESMRRDNISVHKAIFQHKMTDPETIQLLRRSFIRVDTENGMAASQPVAQHYTEQDPSITPQLRPKTIEDEASSPLGLFKKLKMLISRVAVNICQQLEVLKSHIFDSA